MSSSSRKCILIGMDGVNPRFVENMIRKGDLPAFKRMIKEGVYAPYCLSSVPTSTPENWILQSKRLEQCIFYNDEELHLSSLRREV